MSKGKLAFEQIETEVEYASVHAPRNKYESDEKEYSVTLLLNEEKQKEMLAIFKKHNISETVVNPSKGITQPRIRQGDDGLGRLTLKRNEFNSQGVPAKITVVDALTHDLVDDEGKPIMIGNGSTAVVEFFITTNPKTGAGAMKLSGIQVLDLVPFEQKSNFKARDGGFDASKAEGVF